MDLSAKLELFSRTVENRFIFSLFSVLLCGVIVLVIVRGWRARKPTASGPNNLLLLSGFLCLGASFALEATYSGAFFFLRTRLPEAAFELFGHVFQAAAWLLMAASIYREPFSKTAALTSSRVLPTMAVLVISSPVIMMSFSVRIALDLTNLLLVTVVLILFKRRWSNGRRFVTAAMAFVFVAALLQAGASVISDSTVSLVLWNLEQVTWSFSLFAFALAFGEASRELFDRVFVRLQISFILLASLMILVITQTEKADYLASIRERSHDLAEFVRTNVDRFRGQNEPLASIVGREDFLQRAILGFGNLPELKVIQIVTGSQVANFEIADDGEIYSGLEPRDSTEWIGSEEYFLIHSLPLKSQSERVEFYGTREFLDRHIRKRIIVIFSLFTAMVALSTIMIGLVVRGASTVIREQAREIESTQQQLMQTSKLAAIGELAAGVAHEINNPATTVLSMGSFWLSQQNNGSVTCDTEDVKEVVDQAQRIAQITSELLTFSRRQTLKTKPALVDHIVTTSLRLVEDARVANNVSVERDIQPGLQVLADEASLVRALENLFRNAIDAMPVGGLLRIEAATANGKAEQIRLAVVDNGTGIAKEDLPRIFDPFFTTKEVGKGTGLGLSIVHRIVKEHQGTITAESEPGVGTKFMLLLPTEG